MFVYVFNNKDKEELLERGYVLVLEDPRNSIYVFENTEESVFDLSDIKFTYSDVIAI